MVRRVLLFLATNLAVVLVLSVVANLLGADRWLLAQGSGIDLQALLIFSAVFGFGGAFISLAMSKMMAKWSMRVQVIDAPSSEESAWLLSTVQKHATRAGIGMPEVGIFDAPDMNAFATGMSKNSALVAVSTGLLHRMPRNEVDAVIGHEIGHVANGDMVTLTLIQGVVNTFVMFLSRALAFVIENFISRRGDGERSSGGGMVYFLIVMVLQMVFGILASMIVMWFSRAREYRADAAGADLAGRQNMIAALERLRRDQFPSDMPQSLAAFGIHPGQGGLTALLRSHPPLEERIARLQAG